MIDLFYWTTPNGHKISMFLEETGIPFTIHGLEGVLDGRLANHEFLADTYSIADIARYAWMVPDLPGA